MAYEYECEEVIKDVIKELIYFKKGKNKIAEKEIDDIYAKAKAWDNYVDSVRSLVSKHADEDTDIEKEVRDILSVYIEDE